MASEGSEAARCVLDRRDARTAGWLAALPADDAEALVAAAEVAARLAAHERHYEVVDTLEAALAAVTRAAAQAETPSARGTAAGPSPPPLSAQPQESPRAAEEEPLLEEYAVPTPPTTSRNNNGGAADSWATGPFSATHSLSSDAMLSIPSPGSSWAEHAAAAAAIAAPGPSSPPSPHSSRPPAAAATAAGARREGSSTSPSAAAAALSTAVRQSAVYQDSLARRGACEELLASLALSPAWSAVRDDGGGLGLFYQHDRTSGLHLFRASSVLACSLLCAACVLVELDLYHEWFPFCSESRPCGEVSRYHRGAYFVLHAPWPLASRDVFFVGFGVDDTQRRDRIMIVARSASDDPAAAAALPPAITPPPRHRSRVRADVPRAGFLLELVDPAHTRVSFVVSVDPKVGAAAPQWGINWISGKVLWHMLVSLGKTAAAAADKGSVYRRRRLQRPDVYNLLRDRYNDLLRRHFPGAPLLPSDF